MSIRYKIAILFSLLVTLFLAIVSIAVFFFSLREREESFKTRLSNRARTTAGVFAGITDSNYAVLMKIDVAAVSSLYKKSVTVVDYFDSHVYQYADQPGDSMFLSHKIIERAKIENEYYFKYNDKDAVAMHFIDSDLNFIVAVSASDIDGREYLTQLKGILIVTSLVAGMLSFLVGIFFAKSLVRPIHKIAGEVDQITTNNFSQRIFAGNSKDELTRLAHTFNNLLDRLQDSFAIQRRFISNASHEMSTPLTSISTQLEVALQKDRSEEEYRTVLKSVHEDVLELQDLTRCLLDLAKAGTNGSIDLHEVRLDEILFKVIADLRRMNSNYKAKINFKEMPDDESLYMVFGNVNLLYIAFKNIIENGFKYSGNNEIEVIVNIDTVRISVSVFNQGDIIEEFDIKNIFQPFFRGESAKAKPGFGLGLALTKRILLLHKGTIAVDSNHEMGTRFTIELPNITKAV